MNVPLKIITSVLLASAAPLLFSQEQRIIAYKKGTDRFTQYAKSYIEIQQNNNVISGAKFETNTSKSSTRFKNPNKKYLYFDKNGGPITISFWQVADTYGVNQSPGTTPTKYPHQLSGKSLSPSDIPQKSKIKISGSHQNDPANYTIEIEPPLVKVNVKKIDPESHGTKWTIYALTALKDGKQPTGTPQKGTYYDKVTIEKDTTTRRLNVPNNKDFWIFVPDVRGSTLLQDMLTPIKAQTINNKTINIDKFGVAKIV